MPKKVDDTGKRFGRLTVTGRKRENGITFYFCVCDCGKTFTAQQGNIRRGGTKSCGCLKKDIRCETRTQTLLAWRSMKVRCYDPKHRSYHLYGGRGVSVSHFWKDDYIAFRDYIGHPPEDGQKYSVDRIDNNGNYEPGNVRWATPGQQTRNRGMNSANKTGVNGVIINEKHGFYQAGWRTLEGKKKTKSFFISKYGKEEAFRLACEARENAIKELNAQGAGYSKNHGKQRVTHEKNSL